MEHAFMLNVTITSKDDSGKTAVDLHAEGKIDRVGKAILLSNVFKALRIDPDNISDLAVVSVALEKCSDE